MKVFELKAKRAESAKEARRLTELAISENRDNTPEERATVDGILKLMDKYERDIQVLERLDAIDSNTDPADRRHHIDPSDGPNLDGKHPYSLMRALRMASGIKNERGEIETGGIEQEVSQEIAVRSGKGPQGIYIPWNLANPNLAARRSLTAGVSGIGTAGSGTGGGSIANILGTELIQILRNKMVMNKMGARVMTDMTGGTFSLPKQTSTTTAYWLAEGNAPSGSNAVINQVTWTPSSVAAYTDLTRRFLLQTNLDSEMLVRDDLTRMLSVEMDRVGLNGSGQGQQPLGIMQDPNVVTYPINTNGGEPTWALVVQLEKLVAQANAEFGKLGYVTSNAGRAVLKQTPKVTSTAYPIFIWEQDKPGDFTNGAEGIINGYRAMATEQIPSNLSKGSTNAALTALLYGNWDSATYAFWSGLDILVDPFSNSTSGTVRFVAMQDLDVQFRYEAGFAKCVDMNIT